MKQILLSIIALIWLAGAAHAQPDVCNNTRKCPVGDECWDDRFERGVCAERDVDGVPIGDAVADPFLAFPKTDTVCYCKAGSGLSGARGRSGTFFAGSMLGLLGGIPWLLRRRRQ